MATKKKSSKKQSAKPTNRSEGSRQLRSIIWFAVAVFLLCVVFIKGENLWTYMHEFVFGVLVLPLMYTRF